MNFIGATMHFITDKIDGGNIIYKKKHDISNDIDQGLIYFLSFYSFLDLFYFDFFS